MLYRDALDNVADDDAAGQIEARQGRAQARYRLGRHEDALSDYDDALARARTAHRHDAAVEILLDEGVIFDTVHEHKKQEAATHAVQALVGAEPELATPVVKTRLLLARALDSHRADRQAEALELFKETTLAARPLGEAAYEQYSHSLSLSGSVAATLGRFEEAEASLASSRQVFEEHGDMFGLCAALVNRGMLSLVVGNIDRMLADYERARHISREYGIPLIEAACVQDLGEIRLILGQPEQAEPYIRRATEMYIHSVGAGASRVAACEVQLARAKWYAGDHQAAAEIVARVSGQQAEAEAAGHTDAVLVGSLRVVLDQVALALRQAPPEDFDVLIARGRELALQPQDIVEMMEWKALTVIQLGRRSEGIHLLEAAVAEAEQSARLALDRVRRRLDEAKSGPAASAERLA
jgi:tetratricopeptide (TPR) repeat protein